MWILRADDDQTGRILRLRPGSTRTVGRGPRADFIVEAPLVSRVHCRLVATASELTVDDLESTNGTFVNADRVVTSPLHDGDRLRLGRLELVVSHQPAEN